MQQSVFLKFLPGANLGARLAIFLIPIALVGIVFVLLAIFEIASIAPVSGKEFAWAILVGALLLIFATGLLWYLVSREVLKPLENMRLAVQQEFEETTGLDQMAQRIAALREKIDMTQAKLDESHENLRQVERLAMVGKLAAGVAHSVRNPLTSVKLRLFSLERNLALTPRQKEDFTVIAEAMRHVDNIVSNFLEFSRRPRIALQLVSSASIVDAALHLLESRLSAFPVSLTRRRSSQLPLVYADPEQMREALLNILLNACEAMDYSGNLVIEEYVMEDKDELKAYLVIRIQDSGPGIDEEQLARLFVPFYSTKEQGTGLGLPIAKGILEEHGGDILVTSSPQAGTAFSLLLPVSTK